MEMYRTLAPCTVDGEDLSWCLAGGLTWSQLTLNPLWCWECTYPMLVRSDGTRINPLSPDCTGSWVLHAPHHSHLAFRGSCSHPEHVPKHHPVCVVTFPSSWQEGLLFPCCKVSHGGLCLWFKLTAGVFERAGVVPQPTSPTLYRTGCSLPRPPLQRVKQVYPVAPGRIGGDHFADSNTLYSNSRVTGWHPQSTFWSPAQNHAIGELWSSESF